MKRLAFVCVAGMLVLAVGGVGLHAQSQGRALAGALGIEQAEWRAMTKEAKRQHLRSLSSSERQALRAAMGFEEDRSAAAREQRRERLKSLSTADKEELRQFFWGPEAPVRSLRGEARKAAKQDLTVVQRRYVRGLDKAQRQERRQARKARRDAGIPIRRDTPLQVLPPKAVGIIQYDNNLAMGRLATGGLKGNRFDTALTAMGGGPSPVIASGAVTRVSAVLSLDTTTFGSNTTTDQVATLRVLGPGTTTGMAVPLTTTTNTDGVTQVVTFGAPVDYTGPSFIVAFRDDSATTTTTTTTTPTSTGTFTTITTTTTTSMGATSMMTTMTFTVTGTTITTTTSTTNVNRFVPATSTGTVGGQGAHGVAIVGTAVADVAGVNFLVRARGNVVVPVELMGFSIE